MWWQVTPLLSLELLSGPETAAAAMAAMTRIAAAEMARAAGR